MPVKYSPLTLQMEDLYANGIPTDDAEGGLPSPPALTVTCRSATIFPLPQDAQTNTWLSESPDHPPNQWTSPFLST